MAARDDELEMTFRLRGTPEAMAALEQFRRAMQQTGQRRDTGPMTRELDHLRREVRGIAREISSVVRPALAGFGFSASGLVLGITAASLGLNSFSSGVMEVKRGADRIGLTIKEYRGFIDAAQKASIAKPESIAMLENMNKVIYEARIRTNGAWQEIVRLGGADVVGAVLAAKNPVDQMALIWERLEHLKRQDPAKARQWAELWFNNIKATRIEWTDAMTEMASASGLTDEQIKAAKAYHEQWVAAGIAWQRVKETVGTAALEGLTPLVKAITDAMNNKEAVASLAQGLGSLADGLAKMSPDDIKALSDGLGTFIREVGQGVSELAHGLSELMDIIDKVSGKSTGPNGGRMVYDLSAGEFREASPPPPKGAPFNLDTLKRGVSQRWDEMLGLFGRKSKATAETLEGVNTEFQKLVDNLRQAQTTSDGGGGGSSGGAGFSGQMSELLRGGGGGRSAPASYSASRLSGGAVDQPGGSGVPGRDLSSSDKAGFKGLVVHHTGGRGDVGGVVSALRGRGLKGYNYIVDREGNVVPNPLVPEGTPGQHMRPGWGQKGAGLSNQNMEGISAIAKDDSDVTPAQIAAIAAFAKKRQYRPDMIFGHGEVNPGHKEANEGMTAVNAARAAAADGSQLDKAIGSAGSAKARPNSFDISIDATAAGKSKGQSAPIPSSIMENNPKQMAINPQSGVGAQP
jgi:hypothetical protein